MVRGQWPAAVERLAQQLSDAQAADRRVTETKSAAARQDSYRAGLEPAEYQPQVRAYVHSRESKAADRAITAAVAVMKARDAALLRSARILLTRRADERRPPRRLPQPYVLPGGYTPQWWINAITTSYAGIWRAIPATGPELRLGGPDDPLVQHVAKQARLLQASRAGYRGRESLYEAYYRDGTREGGEPVEPIRGLSPALNRRANLLLGRGDGIRIPSARMEEARQMHSDYFAVWDRSRAYAAAVLDLLRARA